MKRIYLLMFLLVLSFGNSQIDSVNSYDFEKKFDDLTELKILNEKEWFMKVPEFEMKVSSNYSIIPFFDVGLLDRSDSIRYKKFALNGSGVTRSSINFSSPMKIHNMDYICPVVMTSKFGFEEGTCLYVEQQVMKLSEYNDLLKYDSKKYTKEELNQSLNFRKIIQVSPYVFEIEHIGVLDPALANVTNYQHWWNFSYISTTWRDSATSGAANLAVGSSVLSSNSYCIGGGSCMYTVPSGPEIGSTTITYSNVSGSYVLQVMMNASETAGDQIMGDTNEGFIIQIPSDGSGFQCTLKRDLGYKTVEFLASYSTYTNYTVFCMYNETELCGSVNNGSLTCTSRAGGTVINAGSYWIIGRQVTMISNAAGIYTRFLNSSERQELVNCIDRRIVPGSADCFESGGAAPVNLDSVRVTLDKNVTSNASIWTNVSCVGNCSLYQFWNGTNMLYNGSNNYYNWTGLVNGTTFTSLLSWNVTWNSSLWNTTGRFTLATNQTEQYICQNSLQNTTASSWGDMVACTLFILQQNRSYIVYDSNNCGNVSNSTVWEYQNVSCGGGGGSSGGGVIDLDEPVEWFNSGIEWIDSFVKTYGGSVNRWYIIYLKPSVDSFIDWLNNPIYFPKSWQVLKSNWFMGNKLFMVVDHIIVGIRLWLLALCAIVLAKSQRMF